MLWSLKKIINSSDNDNIQTLDMGVPGLVQKMWQQKSIKDFNLAKQIFKLDEELKDDAEKLKVINKVFPELSNIKFLAQASVGSVFRGEGEDANYAIKVKHNNIANILKSDLYFFRYIFKIIAIFLPASSKEKILGMIDEAGKEIMIEADYLQEAHYHRWFYEHFQDDAQIKIPQLYEDLSNGNMIVSSYSNGINLFDFLEDASLDDKRFFLETYHRFILESIFSMAMLHADPHPANFLLEQDNDTLRLVVLDFGCVKKFSPAFIDSLQMLLLKIRDDSLDEDSIVSLLISLGFEKRILDYYRPVLSWLIYTLLEPYSEDYDLTPGEWKLDYKIASILSSRPWEEPLEMPSEFIYIFRVYDALITYWNKCRVPMNWYKTLDEVLGGEK